MGSLSYWAIDAWRRSPLSRSPRFRRLLRVPSRANIPEAIPRRAVTLIGEPPKWAVIPCPCGRGHVIDLNLAHASGAQWQVHGDENPTIKPSVDVQDPAGRCHFRLTGGRVRWIHRSRRSAGRSG
jgi:hypothetical protein